MITLIIKGDMPAAINAACARKIALTSFATRIPPLCKEWETIASANIDQLDAVRQWYASGAQDAPFPAGTLLHYSVKQFLA